MFSFLLTIVRVLDTIWRGLRDPEFRDMFIGLMVLLIVGSTFYVMVEGWGVVDAAYFCIMTLSTVGYGDLHPTTAESKIFTIVYLIVGAGLFVGFITKLAAKRRPYQLPRIRHQEEKSS